MIVGRQGFITSSVALGNSAIHSNNSLAESSVDSSKNTISSACADQTTQSTVPGLNAFVDLSHHNLNVDLNIAKKSGLVGIIHKATQNTSFVDNQYAKRISDARDLGLYVGAYHFATASPVEQQIDFFLTTLQKFDDTHVLPCIDWEENPDPEQGNMTQEQLIHFVDTFKNETGVYPVIYGGYWMLNQIRQEDNLGNLSQCPLWQAFYSSAFGYLSDIWSTWSFLQYTDGKLGPEPHIFDGIGTVDRNTFNGNAEHVAAFWQQHALRGR